MAMVNVSGSCTSLLPSSRRLTNFLNSIHHSKSFVKRKTIKPVSCELKNNSSCQSVLASRDNQEVKIEKSSETRLYSFTPLPLLLLSTLPGAGTVRSLFEPVIELVQSWNLPGWLVHWGHPGNMAVVLFAMGGYGTYLGFRIRFSDDVEEKAMAKDLHPKLLAGMFFFCPLDFR